jgi:hypothetical protein
MSLIPTRVVDKNGRATTVHKRSGSSAVQNKTLSAAKPAIGGAGKVSKIDQKFSHKVDAGFAFSRFGIVLNEMRPDLALDPNSILDEKNTINFSSREVYSLARHGFAPRDCIYMAHFQLTPEEAFAVRDRLAVMGHEAHGKFTEKPWMDAMLDADIDHRDLLKAYDNGLTQHDLQEMPPENAPDTITAYGYKGFSKTKLAEKVRDGKVSWDEIKLIGVSRATKYEWTISNIMDRRTKENQHSMTYAILSEIIKDAEKKPRTTLDSRTPAKTENLISSHSQYYAMVGEQLWDLHMPEVLDNLSRIIEAKSDLSGYAGYCDEVIHRVRSSPGTAESVISANGGKSKNGVGGSYAGQYEEQRDPVWNFHTLVQYRDAGLSVDECVYALSKGLTPERAQGVLQEGIPLAVNEGWL